MRRVLTTLLLAVAMLALLAPPVGAANVAVIQGTNNPSIDLAAVQAAVDQADQVILEGTFDFGDGTLVIARDNVILKGDDAAVIRNGGTDIDVAINVEADGVQIRDLTMVNPSHTPIGVFGDGAVISGNTLTGAFPSGISVWNSNETLIRNNSVTGYLSNGILVLGGLPPAPPESSGHEIRNNTLTSAPAGIADVDVSGIALIGVSDFLISNNKVNNEGAGFSDIFIFFGIDGEVRHNTLTPGEGSVLVVSSFGVTVDHNRTPKAR